MSKGKLEKFAMLADYANCVEPSMDEARLGSIPLKGKWHKDFFKNDNPLTVELACGGGEYTVGMAEMYPDRNFIGIDIKGNRIWKGATKAIEKNLTNVGFLRTRIDFIINCFAEDEVDELWITFPDPQIKYKRTKHRMTNSDFMKKYHQVLKKDGLMNLKTDSEFMHGYTLGLLHGEGHEILNANHNVYKNEGSPKEVTETQTFYENQYLQVGKPITYIQFRLKY